MSDKRSSTEVDRDRRVNAASKVPENEHLLVRELMITEVVSREDFESLLSGLRRLGCESFPPTASDEETVVSQVERMLYSHRWGWVAIPQILPSRYKRANEFLPVLYFDLPQDFFAIQLRVERTTSAVVVLSAFFTFADAYAQRMQACINLDYQTTDGPTASNGLHPRYGSEHLRLTAVREVYSDLLVAGTSWLAEYFRGMFARNTEANISRPRCWVLTVEQEEPLNFLQPAAHSYLNFAGLHRDSNYQLRDISTASIYAKFPDGGSGARQETVLIGLSQDLVSGGGRGLLPIDDDNVEIDSILTASGWTESVGHATELLDRFIVWDSVASALELKYYELGKYRNEFGRTTKKLSSPRQLTATADQVVTLLFDTRSMIAGARDLIEKPLFTSQTPKLTHCPGSGLPTRNPQAALKHRIIVEADACEQISDVIQDVLPTVATMRATAASIRGQRISIVVGIIALSISALTFYLTQTQDPTDRGPEAPTVATSIVPPAPMQQPQDQPSRPLTDQPREGDAVVPGR